MRSLVEQKPIWMQLSKKAKDKILYPDHTGCFSQIQENRQGFRVITSEAGSFSSGAMLRFHWLVDLDDGVITDTCYQCFGPTILIAALETVSEMILSKAYDRVQGLNFEEIEKKLRDRPETPSLPMEAEAFVNLILEALDKAAASAGDIAIAHPAAPSPSSESMEMGAGQYQNNWYELTDKQRLAIVRETIEKEIRPYVELDQGGVEATHIEEQVRVQIVYSGACDGCFASTGSTLSSIQAILRAKIHSDIRVEPVL